MDLRVVVWAYGMTWRCQVVVPREMWCTFIIYVEDLKVVVVVGIEGSCK
jgi:hypothetical protein